MGTRLRARVHKTNKANKAALPAETKFPMIGWFGELSVNGGGSFAQREERV